MEKSNVLTTWQNIMGLLNEAERATFLMEKFCCKFWWFKNWKINEIIKLWMIQKQDSHYQGNYYT